MRGTVPSDGDTAALRGPCERSQREPRCPGPAARSPRAEAATRSPPRAPWAVAARAEGATVSVTATK
ncbi:unnamed protein product [Lampetra planeri]